MKKNISINICGTIYAIDEDAYELLSRYLDGMKRYFCNEGEEDIADDIEHRVAELLWEQKQTGAEAVNREMIKDIIDKIGNPSDIANNEGRHTEEQEKEDSEACDFSNAQTTDGDSDKQSAEATADTLLEKIKKRIDGRHLYRNTKDKMMGGVCSGLAEYFGGDAVMWRLACVGIVVLLWALDYWWMPSVVRWFIPVLYMILLVVVPEAKTPEDKIRMQGKNVNPDTLKEQIVNDIQEEEAAPQPVRNNGSGCLKIIFGCILVITIIPLLGLLALLVFGLVFLVAVSIGAAAELFTFVPGLETMSEVVRLNAPYFWIGVIAGLVVVAMPIKGIISLFRGDAQQTSSNALVTKIIVWIVALAVVICCCIFGGVTTANYFNEHSNDDDIEMIEENIHQQLDSIAESFEQDTEAVEKETGSAAEETGKEDNN